MKLPAALYLLMTAAAVRSLFCSEPGGSVKRASQYQHRAAQPLSTTALLPGLLPVSI